MIRVASDGGHAKKTRRPISSALVSVNHHDPLMASLTVVFIVLLVSSWLNVALYTLELVLCRRYFRRPCRPFIHKICVAGLIFCDTMCTLAVCVDVTMAVVGIHAPNFRLMFAPLSTAIITTYMAASIAQGFLCNLYRIL